MARRGTQLRAAMQNFVRRSCSAALVLLSWSVSRASTEGSVAAPTDDPVASLYPPSSGSTRTPPNLDASWFSWSNVVTISSVAEDPGRAYAAAAAAVLRVLQTAARTLRRTLALSTVRLSQELAASLVNE